MPCIKIVFYIQTKASLNKGTPQLIISIGFYYIVIMSPVLSRYRYFSATGTPVIFSRA